MACLACKPRAGRSLAWPPSLCQIHSLPQARILFPVGIQIKRAPNASFFAAEEQHTSILQN
eukprot:scaffold111_cov404-Prasinococcus_capsulatus_cf.AAC.14